MKLKSVLVFIVVIVLFAFAAIAKDEKEYELAFKGDGYFVAMFDPATGDLVFPPPAGFDLLNVSHLGESEVVWELRVVPFTLEFISGTFTITAANGDTLEGDYSDFVLHGTGEYDLDWVFTGGEGRFEGATGTGHTDGLANLLTGYAEFEFSGKVTVPK